ncbi:MAG: LamG domain-containing protein, partial [Crocinitomicaceae bacterium]
MKKLVFTAFAVGLSLTANFWAQVPSYVPTNGLVGWWPFNGNANDEGPNSINGTISGATFSSDRFSNLNAASSYYGSNDFIQIPTTSGLFNNQQYTISYWFKTNQSASSANGGPNVNPAIISRLNVGGPSANSPTSVDNFVIYEISGSNHFNTPVNGGVTGNNTLLGNTWHHVVFTVRTDSTITYLNGIKLGANINNGNITFQPYPIRLGRSQHTYWRDFSGELDDLGYWNRALTDQEVTDLYNSVNCYNNLTLTPQTNTLITGSTATFTATTSDPNSSFVWQSDFGQGFQTLNNYGNYFGVNTNTLTISNVQLANHNQQIRAISTSGNCVDTSNIATIQIADTCITNVTVYDTLLTTVTDTLIINTTLSLPAPNSENTILIYPNPASDHIT